MSSSPVICLFSFLYTWFLFLFSCYFSNCVCVTRWTSLQRPPLRGQIKGYWQFSKGGHSWVKLRASPSVCLERTYLVELERWPSVSVGVFFDPFFYFCVISSVSPSIEPKSQTIYISSPKPAFLPCNHSGFPLPSVYWTVTHFGVPKNITRGDPVSLISDVNGKLIVQKLEMFENGTLHIFEVDYPHSEKQYQCTAVNRLGVAKGNVRLTVVGGMFVCLFVLLCFVLFYFFPLCTVHVQKRL